MANTNKYVCCHSWQTIQDDDTPVISAVMFGLGIFGNVAALVILEFRRRKDSRSEERQRRGLFLIFVNALVFTDLAGTCLITPIVQIAYARNRTLVGMFSNHSTNSSSLCEYFGVSMTFFSLATISLLFITALDRCFAIGHPYMYQRLVTKKWAYITIPVMFLICTLFSLLPLVGFGDHVQYCPGTWCFIDMNPGNAKHRFYAVLYATIMLVLVLAVVACNGFVIKQLLRMYRRRNRQNSVMKNMKSSSERKILVAHELEHLIPLVVMTIIFIICTMPLVIRVYINAWKGESHEEDLIALRFISFNSIVDPWVFILLNPSVLHFFRLSFCKAPLGKFRDTVNETTLTKENGDAHLTLCRSTIQTDCLDTEHL
uniref:Prostaglandin E2 receptor EP2 subtype n=1 Tax=Fundulus heteroclitus TaxID=8078 RepID=A0A3Q2NMY5_FUNHE